MVELRAALRQYLQQNFLLGSTGADFGDADSFLEMQILDSTGFLELMAHLEEIYGITVRDEEMIPENLDSLDRLVEFIVRKRGVMPAHPRGGAA